MKTSFLVFTLLLLILSNTKAQKVFEVEYESRADIKVFVVDYESRADLCVYEVEYESRANKPGLWFWVEYESRADKKIFFVEYESRADLKIFYVKYESRAGWKNDEKKPLLKTQMEVGDKSITESRVEF